MKLLSLFSGIGAFEKALENIGVDYELVGFSEIDKWAIESYCAIHEVDKSLNLGDVSEIRNEDLPNEVDLITYGFPCQDISTAGKQAGIKKDTRSGLLYEAEMIINHIKPQYAIAENVKNLVGKRHRNDFHKLLERLDSYGYNNYWKVLNAKDYGIPQNRERVFIVSIRRDIDDGTFTFPEPMELTTSLSDYIDFREEDNLTDNFVARYEKVNGEAITTEDFIDYISNLPIRRGVGTKLMGLYSFNETDTVTTLTGITGTLTTRNVQNYNKKYETDRGLYKPSPLMCWRLMGFSDEDFSRVSELPDGELYKQAGNSIVVNVLEEIFINLFKNEGE